MSIAILWRRVYLNLDKIETFDKEHQAKLSHFVYTMKSVQTSIIEDEIIEVELF